MGQSQTMDQKFRKGFLGVPLTKRDIEVLDLLVDAYSLDEVADTLQIKKTLVSVRLQRIRAKMGVLTTAGAVVRYMRDLPPERLGPLPPRGRRNYRRGV